MYIEMQTPKIRSEETPREIIAADFKSLRDELPISGGWGYSKEDAVVIDKNDPVVPKGLPFDGIGIEYVFVEKRIYEELIIFRPDDSKFAGIEWKLIEQRLVSDDDRKFDVLSFDVTAIPDIDWELLKREWEQNHGFQTSQSALEAHIEKKNSKTVHYTAEYWFDITSFFGQGLVITDKSSGKKKLLPPESFNFTDKFKKLFGRK